MNRNNLKISTLFVMCLIAVIFTNCVEINVDSSPKVNGEGPLIEENIAVTGFSGIESTICGNIIINQGDNYNCTIKAQKNIIQVIDFKVENKQLKISSNVDIKSSKEITIYIISPEYNRIVLTGAGDIKAQNCISTDYIELRLTGAGNIYFNDFYANSISTEITGTGNIQIIGNKVVDYHKMVISGTGNIETFDLPVNEVVIISSGVGNCNVNSIKTLDVTISGVGSVCYKGSPIITSKISGIGSLIRKD